MSDVKYIHTSYTETQTNIFNKWLYLVQTEILRKNFPSKLFILNEKYFVKLYEIVGLYFNEFLFDQYYEILKEIIKILA